MNTSTASRMTLVGFLMFGSVATAQGPTPWYQSATTLSGPSSPPKVVAVDFNLDGFPDIATARGNATQITIFHGAGSSSFTTTTVSTSIKPTSLLAADLNADGQPDLLFGDSAQTGQGSVSYKRGNGAFGFGNDLPITPSNPTIPNPSCLALGDVEGDGLVDIAVGYLSATGIPSVGIFLNTSSAPGTFTPSFLVACQNTGGAPVDVALHDLNGDGHADFVVAGVNATNSSGTFTNTLNGYFYVSGVGTYSVPNFFIDFGSSVQQALCVGDMDGDTLVDIAVSSNGSAGFQRFLNTGSSSAPTFASSPGTGAAANLSLPAFVMTDLNGDGVLDASVVDIANNRVQTFIYFPSLFLGFINSVGTSPIAITAADFNLDAWTDVVTANSGASSLSLLLAQSVSWGSKAVPYGAGTPGCFGTMSLGANSLPLVNSPQFALVGANAPRDCLVSLLASNVGYATSTFDATLGINWEIDLISGTLQASLMGVTDANGTMYVPAPIPNNPALSNVALYCQALLLEMPTIGQQCNTGSSYGLISSAGIVITP